MAIVFSPHLDDAVLSASARLMAPETQVVTVFAGAPPDGIAPTAWERLTRASSSPSRHRERLAEDRAAMATLGCRATYLDQPEAEHRQGPLDPTLLRARVRPFLIEAAEVWIPAGIGGHPDHLAARDAVLAARETVDHAIDVVFYADLPYAVRYGWPAWATGAATSDFLDPDRWLADELNRRGLDLERLAPSVVELTPAMRTRKTRALESYRSQLPALGLGTEEGDRWATFLRYEIAWRKSYVGL